MFTRMHLIRHAIRTRDPLGHYGDRLDPDGVAFFVSAQFLINRWRGWLNGYERIKMEDLR